MRANQDAYHATLMATQAGIGTAPPFNGNARNRTLAARKTSCRSSLPRRNGPGHSTPPPQSSIPIPAPSFLDQMTRPPCKQPLRQTQLPFQPNNANDVPNNDETNNREDQNGPRPAGRSNASQNQQTESR